MIRKQQNTGSWAVALFLATALMTFLSAMPLLAEDSPAGHWSGNIELPGQKLKVDVDLAAGESGWSGDISIPAQGAKNLSLGDIVVDGASIRFTIQGIPGEPTFKGELSADNKTVSGTFSQGGQEFPFELTRGVDMVAKVDAALDGFEDFLKQAMSDWQTVGLAIGVVADGELVYARGLGYRDLENKLPVTPDTLFAIGSASKAFTTFGLATQVDEGKMDWDSPVINYLPEWRLFDDNATRKVTPRDMVTHRSGLPRHDLVWYNNDQLTRTEALRRLQYLEPNKDLRETFQYNNHMYVMAGHLLGRLDDSPWEEAVTNRIFKPLGMTNSNFSVVDSQASSDHALPYQVHEDAVEKMAFRDISNVGPAGSINSSVNDMSRWLQVHLSEGKFQTREILTKQALQELYTPQMVIRTVPSEPMLGPTSYGMGWFLTTYRGHYRVQHGGNIDGFSALVSFFPRDNLGLVVLANQNGSPLPALATNHAVDRIFDQSDKSWHAEAFERYKKGREMQKEADKDRDSVRITGTAPAHPLEAYAGVYSHPGYGDLTIGRDEAGGSLHLEYNNIRAPLTHWHYEVFNGEENPDDRTFEHMKLRFATGLDGRIESVAAPFEALVDDIVFVRKADDNLTDPVYLARFEGDYTLGPQTFTIKLRGEILTMTLANQPTLELVPTRDDEFDLKGLNGFSVQFQSDEEGEIAVVKQPNGVFKARKAAAGQ